MMARRISGEATAGELRRSRVCRCRDAVDPAALFLGRSEGQPELFLFRVPEKMPRTVCRCQPVALATSSTVTPSGRRSIAMTSSCFDGRLSSDWGSGNASIADHN
jgi:hypothetical protein